MRSLWEITLAMAREIRKGGIWEGTATAATDTTIDDATIGLIDGAVDGGTIWFHEETPPVSRIITSWLTPTVTFTPDVTGLAPQRYTIFGRVYPRHSLREAANRALRNIGEFADYELMDTEAGVEDYAIPVTVTSMLKSVEISAFPDPASAINPHFRLHQGWIQFADTLRFMARPPRIAGVDNMRLGFNIPHPELAADDDEIRREVSPERLTWESIAQGYIQLIAPRDSESLDEQTKDLYTRAAQMAARMPVHRNQPLPDPHLFLGVGSRGAGQTDPDLLV